MDVIRQATRRTNRATGVLLGLLVSGCVGDMDAFVDRRATQICKRNDRCGVTSWEVVPTDREECREYYVDNINEFYDASSCQAFDVEQGRECLKEGRKRRQECGTNADTHIAIACTDVFVQCTFPVGG